MRHYQDQWQHTEQNLGHWIKIAKQLATFERKLLRRMSGGIKVNENWRK